MLVNNDPDELFVYGSLMPDFPLHHIIAGWVEDPRKAETNGIMFAARGHKSYPYVVFGTQGIVHGVVLHIRRGYKERLIKTLDFVEGHPRHYKRVVRKVYLDTREFIDAYMYDGQQTSSMGDPIPSGIWELVEE